MVRVLILVLFFGLSVFGTSIEDDKIKTLTNEFNKMSDEQLSVLATSYRLGKHDNLGLTVAAIAWKESSAGVFQINKNSNKSWDCGIFGNNTNTVLNHVNEKTNKWNKRKVCTKLIIDPLYAYEKAFTELKLWEKYWTKRKYTGSKLWYKIWGSYNGGSNSNATYAKEIHHKTIVLARNVWKLNKYK